MASAHSPPLTACPTALQDRSARTKKAIVEQPGLIDHPTLQGFGISIVPEPRTVSGCLPCTASAEMGKWDGSNCKGRYLEGPRSSSVLKVTAAWRAIGWVALPLQGIGPCWSTLADYHVSRTGLGLLC